MAKRKKREKQNVKKIPGNDVEKYIKFNEYLNNISFVPDFYTALWTVNYKIISQLTTKCVFKTYWFSVPFRLFLYCIKLAS